jgi:DNA-binding transcriptional ArsR family regulator
MPPPQNFGPKPRVSWNVNARLMRLLWDGPHTMRELIEETGLSESTVRGYVKALRNNKLVAITDLVGRHGTHIYQWKPDAKDYKRKKLTPAERQKRCRERKEASRLTAALCFRLPVPEHADPAPC